MSLVALNGMPLVIVGSAGQQGGSSTLPTAGNVTIDAANEACIMIGQIFTEDGGSHTVDTTGSSSLGWKSNTVTFADAGTTVKVGLAAVDTATGPPGRAVNVANVITFDVSKSHTGGGGGITGAAWQENVPDTGTKTIANGDMVAFCIQMTARGGADSIQSQTGLLTLGPAMPTCTGFLGGSYTTLGTVPNAVITFSDGTLGFFYGGSVFSTATTSTTWNSASGTKEYGNFFQLPVPTKVYGLLINTQASANFDAVLYSDPLGTPVAEKTASFDLNTVGVSSTDRWFVALFSSPYTTTASQPLAGIIKPGGSSVSALHKTFNVSAHQKSEPLGTNCYAVNRASGAFAAQNSSKDRYAIGLLVGAFDAGGSGGLAANPLRGFVG